MQPIGRKRRATEDATEENNRSVSHTVALPATQEIAVEVLKSLQALPDKHIETMCEFWLPKTNRTICLLDNPTHLRPKAPSYRPMKSMMAMLLHMAAMQHGDDQAKATTDLVTSTIKEFYLFNIFEVDLQLIREFFEPPSAVVDRQIVSKYIRHLTVIVQVQSDDETGQLACLLDFLNHNMNHHQRITIKFRGPGAKDGSDTNCQRKIAQLCGVINDIFEKCHGQWADDVFGQNRCTLNIVREQGLWGSEYSISKWFRKPSDEVIGKFDKGTASYDEGMQVQVAQWIRDIKKPKVTELVKQEA